MNVSIPQKICADLNYPFRPIYLEEEYENSFSDYAWQSIILSDGFVIQRANYPYAFEKISDFSDVVITGLFGSEFLRTFQNLGTVVSVHFARINDANGDIEILTGIMDQLERSSYLSADIFEPSIKNEVIEDVKRWFEEYGSYPRDQRVYLYLLTEVTRKYFAAELSTERIYATSRLPFLDDEFVEFIFKAPFAGVYSKTITPTVKNRFKSQQFYAYIIKKYKPELLKYFTDHGYPPGDLLSPFSLILVGVKYLIMRMYKKATSYDEFRPKKWMRRFYSENRSFLIGQPMISAPSFQQDLDTERFIENLDEFNKVGAIVLWLKFLQDNSSSNHLSTKNCNHPKGHQID
jgi:hypothetical protein